MAPKRRRSSEAKKAPAELNLRRAEEFEDELGPAGVKALQAAPSLNFYRSPVQSSGVRSGLPPVQEDADADNLEKAIVRERRACDIEHRQMTGKRVARGEVEYLRYWRDLHPRP